MLKSLSQLEVKIGENVYLFTCSPTSPFNEVKDSLCQFLTYIGTLENSIKEQLAQQQALAGAQDQTPSAVAPTPDIAPACEQCTG